MSTTTITMLRNPAKQLDCYLLEGETGEVQTTLADTLVKMGIAVVVEQPKVIKAIPDPPTIVAAVAETQATATEEPRPQGRHAKPR